MKCRFLLLVLAGLLFQLSIRGQDYLVFPGKSGPGAGKHIVLLSGDEEYRSEESLPQLAKILSERHGFKCTVLFAIDPADHTIHPNVTTNCPHVEALDSADAIVMLLRFRQWPDEQMTHFVDAYLTGKPIIALRTSTHAFSYSARSTSPYKNYSWNSTEWPGGFGKQVLGETWVSHHGAHKKEATRGVIEPSAKGDPILRGVKDIFGDTDVYTANPPSDAKIILRGQVLAGMTPDSPALEGPKNNPMQPVAWTRIRRNESSNTNRIFCTTMGAATDLQCEDLRRLVVNAVYWGLGLEVPARADVALVGEYHPSNYGFDGFRRGVKPADLKGLGKNGNADGPARAASAGARLSSGAADTNPIKPLKVGRDASAPAAAQASRGPNTLELKPGDHIALVGNALADRFQHTGWLEALIQSKYPEHDLVFRNLAAAGDEVGTWHRPENFGSRDDWLKKTQADVVFAFYGFNESFQGKEGLPGFKADLEKFLKEMQAHNFSGKGNARVVLFSPIANEHAATLVARADLFDAASNNANVKLYAAAMREVAQQCGVQFVDLFEPSKELFKQSEAAGEPLTIDGVHLTDKGDALIAGTIAFELFGAQPTEGPGSLPPGTTSEAFQKLRAAIIERNEMWHSRYRTIDGYNVYGGRSALAYQPDKGGFITDRQPAAPYVSNYKVMQEEMAQRDLMTANRDKKVWAAARGKDYVVEDSNVPSVTKVQSNHPGPKEDKSFEFLSGEAAIAKMKVHPGLKVNLFASEERFPELIKPVQMAWDTKGRLWVAAWRNYPERTPDSKTGDSILIFEDTDGDGKADKCTHFIDDLNGPTGFQFYKDGILLMQAPDLWFVRDTTGGDHVNSKERVLMGLSSADSHHTANSMCLDPCGAVYLSDGVFHRTQVETATGPVRNNDAAIFRFEPRTARFETYVAYNFANPHGRVFDYWGNDLITDATGNNTYFGPAFSGHVDYPAKHSSLKEFWNRPSRPCAGTALLTSRHFPDDFQGNFLDCNVISFQGIYRVKVSEDGAGLKGETQEPLVSSSDPNFRPVAVNVGPDGAVYFADWQNPIIGHMQHHLRDPNRDHEHGRIYRITCPDRPLLKRPAIAGQPIPKLLDLLKEPENQVREWAKIELGKHEASEVVPAVRAWAGKLNSTDPSDPEYQHSLLEALWVQQWFNVLDKDLLNHLLTSSNPRVRAAAARVLCYDRDRFPESLETFKKLAADQSLRVRLEAVRAASFFRSAEAAEVPFIALANESTDYYLDYVTKETLHQLEPWWRKAIQENSPQITKWAEPRYAQARDFIFDTMSTADILKLPHSAMVLDAIICRKDMSDADRVNAMAALAEMEHTNLTIALVLRLQQFSASDPSKLSDKNAQHMGYLSRLLPYCDPAVLKTNRSAVASFTTSSSGEARENAQAALVMADDAFDTVWSDGGKSPTVLVDILNGIPRLTNPDLRSKAFDKVKELLEIVAPAPPARRAAIRAIVSMTDHHDYAFAALTRLISKQIEVPTCVRGIRSIPQPKWPKEDSATAAAALANWCASRPVAARSEQEFSEAVQLAGDLARALAPADSSSLRAKLKELKVSSFVIRTVREQMRYDTPRLVVEAGKPFEIVFENADFMPHNLVVVEPNTREKIGLAANAMKPDELDGEKRPYVPKLSGILGATHLLATGEHETLKLTAPSKTGDYEYVCTFPGHYQVMWGRLIITNDVEGYLAANPEPVIPSAPNDDVAGATPARAGHEHAR